MAFFSSPASPIAKMDMQAATAPGRAWGNAYASMGQSLANGLSTAVQSYYRAKDEKEIMEQATTVLQNIAEENPELAQRLGIRDTKDKGVFKAVVKTIGGPAQALQLATQLQQQKQAMEMNAMRTQEIEAARRDNEALNRAIAMSTDTDGNVDTTYLLNAYRELGGRVTPEMLDKFSSKGDAGWNTFAIPGTSKVGVAYGKSFAGMVDTGGDKTELTQVQREELRAIDRKIGQINSRLLDLRAGNLGYAASASNPDTIKELEDELKALGAKRESILYGDKPSTENKPEPKVEAEIPPKPPGDGWVYGPVFPGAAPVWHKPPKK